MTPPLEFSEPRRSFVKKTLATSVSISFAGLIRAHGEEGGGATTTTYDPQQTEITTESQTTYDPQQTEATTESQTTTYDPQQTEVTTATHWFDINERTAVCGGAAVIHDDNAVPAWSAEYHQSVVYSVDLPEWFKIQYPNLLLFYKLKLWYDPAELNLASGRHVSEASIRYKGEMYGHFLTNGSPLIQSFLINTEEQLFKGICDSGSGHITPTNAQIPGTTSSEHIYQGSSFEHRLKIQLKDLVLAPVNGGASVTLTGKLKAIYEYVPNGDEGEDYEQGVNPEKIFVLTMKSHEHPASA